MYLVLLVLLALSCGTPKSWGAMAAMLFVLIYTEVVSNRLGFAHIVIDVMAHRCGSLDDAQGCHWPSGRHHPSQSFLVPNWEIG